MSDKPMSEMETIVGDQPDLPTLKNLSRVFKKMDAHPQGVEYDKLPLVDDPSSVEVQLSASMAVKANAQAVDGEFAARGKAKLPFSFLRLLPAFFYRLKRLLKGGAEDLSTD